MKEGVQVIRDVNGSVHSAFDAPAPIASRNAEAFRIEIEDIGPRRLVHAARVTPLPLLAVAGLADPRLRQPPAAIQTRLLPGFRERPRSCCIPVIVVGRHRDRPGPRPGERSRSCWIDSW